MIDISFSGKNCVELALASPFVEITKISCTQEWLEHWPHLHNLRKKGLLSICEKKALFSDGKHQGIIANARLTLYKHFEELDISSWKTVLVLDHLQDPMNVGSAIRHAAAFDVDAIVLPKYQAAPINALMIQASVGAIFTLPIIQPNSFAQSIESLKKNGFGVIGTTLSEESQDFNPNIFWDKTALIIGNEGSGLSPGVAKKCDSLVTIPMSDRIQSLNAAVTSALLCYERFKQKNQL